jgi:hypothetical protein
MKRLVVGALMLASFGASAECWVVSNLKGQTQFGPEYRVQDDTAEGIYHLKINKKSASLDSVGGTYHSGLIYTPTSSISMIGISNGDSSSFVETWTIMPDNKVAYTKVRAIPGITTQISSFVGSIDGKCD